MTRDLCLFSFSHALPNYNDCEGHASQASGSGSGLGHAGLESDNNSDGAHEDIGFDLGWDHAHYKLPLPKAYADEASSLRDGFIAGQATFRNRTLHASAQVKRWLKLRLHAWLRGRSLELFQVTPHYLQQIEVSHCPITRVCLSGDQTSEASINRVRHDAGYAAGNLAVLSQKAHLAKAAHDHRAALRLAEQIDVEKLGGVAGLSSTQWRRVAVLCSFVEPLSHEDACQVPLLVLPPNRLRLFNPVQALQAFVSLQLLKPGWSQRLSRIEELIPGASARADFKQFFLALLPRVLEAGNLDDWQQARCAIEDAWAHSLVQQRWRQFARQLTAAQCETVVQQASARKLGTGHVVHSTPAQATEGWQLENHGYVAGHRLNSMRSGVIQMSLPI